MYNALRLAGEWAVAANGSRTDAITEKIGAGTPVRDALVLSLLALDYEKDAYDTPRIAAAVPFRGDSGWLGIVRRDALLVKETVTESRHGHLSGYLRSQRYSGHVPERVRRYFSRRCGQGNHRWRDVQAIGGAGDRRRRLGRARRVRLGSHAA